MNDDFLLEIQNDFYKVAARLKVYALAITQKFENPIFFMSFENLNMPLPILISMDELSNKANYYACYVEILKRIKIIDNVDLFMQHYKNPGAFCCLIYLGSKKNNKVIYLPYEKK